MHDIFMWKQNCNLQKYSPRLLAPIIKTIITQIYTETMKPTCQTPLFCRHHRVHCNYPNIHYLHTPTGCNFIKPDICFGSYTAIFRGSLSLKLHILKRLFHWFTFRQGFSLFSLLGMHRHYLLFVLK
jgi:hypothetical protein